ncbi:PAS-domain containing protein [Tropicimonas sp. S265A]|uniref:PAS-domain containing protein n=1 Tax=Tropicimonas sp. S265A TaxID=3415134 RepID=UPI003C7AD0DF
MLELDLTGFATLVAVSFLTAAAALAALRFLGPDPATTSHSDQALATPPGAAVSPEVSAELDRLRATVANVPVLLWVQSEDGAISWANKAYIDRADQLFPDKAGTWPLARIFKATSLAHPDTAGSRRIAVEVETVEKHWFDVEGFRVGDDFLYSATPIDLTIKAEHSLRSFVQTLTSTFAHLQVGLAIFDKRRQLVLFNPALTDLTTLEPEWLSSRPSLAEVLDRLRDRNMLPEPKDYKEWRNRLTSLEAAANRGAFEETWALSTGQNFRIRARPHHDGGIAITIEDVSSELSLTRRFRSEIELGQGVIDSVAPPLAVFNEGGVLVMSSAAYDSFFSYEFGQELRPQSVVDATALWQEVFEPSPVWGDIRDFGWTDRSRSPWEDTVYLRDGHVPYRCRISPLAAGMTMVAFDTVVIEPRKIAPVDSTPQTLAG